MVSFGQPPSVPVNSSPGNSPENEVGIPEGIEILKYWFLGDGTLTVVRENSRHYATPPLFSERDDVWETSAEIPYWWRVTTQIWVVLLIGWSKFRTQHRDHSEAPLGSG